MEAAGVKRWKASLESGEVPKIKTQDRIGEQSKVLRSLGTLRGGVSPSTHGRECFSILCVSVNSFRCSIGGWPEYSRELLSQVEWTMRKCIGLVWTVTPANQNLASIEYTRAKAFLSAVPSNHRKGMNTLVLAS